MRAAFLVVTALLGAPSLAFGQAPGLQPTIVSPLSYGAGGTLSAAITSGVLFTAGTYSKVATFCTLPTSTANVWLNLAGGTAAVNAGTPVYGGGGCTTLGTQSLPMPTSAVTSITDGASAQILTVSGG